MFSMRDHFNWDHQLLGKKEINKARSAIGWEAEFLHLILIIHGFHIWEFTPTCWNLLVSLKSINVAFSLQYAGMHKEVKNLNHSLSINIFPVTVKQATLSSAFLFQLSYCIFFTIYSCGTCWSFCSLKWPKHQRSKQTFLQRRHTDG